jgi:folate-binding protein YgfZ
MVRMIVLPTASPADQYRAAVEGCALVDHTDREHIELTGRDRATFLHNFCTQEIKKLPAERGAEAFVTSIKGKILGHALVFAGEEALWLDGPPGTAAVLVPHLDRYLITEDVQIRDRSADWGELGLIGPGAGRVAEAFVPGAAGFVAFQHGHRDGVTVRRFDFTRHPGWLIGAERPRLAAIAEQCRQAGATVCGRDVFDALRIEAGFPQFGVDLTDEHLAHEAGRTQQAISFTKGCYLGQEPIARLESLGHTNRELRGVRLDDGTLPAAGDAVLNGESGAELGLLTSAALSPGAGAAVGLAMLRREACAPGTKVSVRTAAGARGATVFR